MKCVGLRSYLFWSIRFVRSLYYGLVVFFIFYELLVGFCFIDSVFVQKEDVVSLFYGVEMLGDEKYRLRVVFWVFIQELFYLRKDVEFVRVGDFFQFRQICVFLEFGQILLGLLLFLLIILRRLKFFFLSVFLLNF